MTLQDLKKAKIVAMKAHDNDAVTGLNVVISLLMVQEKTNRHDAFMFKKLLEELKDHKDIFKIVATASLTKR